MPPGCPHRTRPRDARNPDDAGGAAAGQPDPAPAQARRLDPARGPGFAPRGAPSRGHGSRWNAGPGRRGRAGAPPCPAAHPGEPACWRPSSPCWPSIGTPPWRRRARHCRHTTTGGMSPGPWWGNFSTALEADAKKVVQALAVYNRLVPGRGRRLPAAAPPAGDSTPYRSSIASSASTWFRRNEAVLVAPRRPRVRLPDDPPRCPGGPPGGRPPATVQSRRPATPRCRLLRPGVYGTGDLADPRRPRALSWPGSRCSAPAAPGTRRSTRLPRSTLSTCGSGGTIGRCSPCTSGFGSAWRTRRLRSISLGQPRGTLASNWMTDLPRSVRYYEEGGFDWPGGGRRRPGEPLAGRVGRRIQRTGPAGFSPCNAPLRPGTRPDRPGRRVGVVRRLHARRQHVLKRAGRAAGARHYFEESLALDATLGRRTVSPRALRNIGYSLGQAGAGRGKRADYYTRQSASPRRAAEQFRADLGILPLPHRRGPPAAGEIEAALDLSRQALELGDDSGMIQTQVEARHVRALAYLQAGQPEPACATILGGQEIPPPDLRPRNGAPLGHRRLPPGRPSRRPGGISKPAVARAREVLQRSPENHSAGLTLALALCGQAHVGVVVAVEEIRRLVARAGQAGANSGEWTDRVRLLRAAARGGSLLARSGPTSS